MLPKTFKQAMGSRKYSTPIAIKDKGTRIDLWKKNEYQMYLSYVLIVHLSCTRSRELYTFIGPSTLTVGVRASHSPSCEHFFWVYLMCGILEIYVILNLFEILSN